MSEAAFAIMFFIPNSPSISETSRLDSTSPTATITVSQFLIPVASRASGSVASTISAKLTLSLMKSTLSLFLSIARTGNPRCSKLSARDIPNLPSPITPNCFFISKTS